MERILRMADAEAVNVVQKMYEKYKREKGRPKRGGLGFWRHVKTTDVCEYDANDRNKWKARSRVAVPVWLEESAK